MGLVIWRRGCGPTEKDKHLRCTKCHLLDSDFVLRFSLLPGSPVVCATCIARVLEVWPNGKE